MDGVWHGMLGAGDRRIGIFGGSFDPVHTGHLILADSALHVFGLERVWFMPCADQPLKPGLAGADGETRKRMLMAAIEDHPGFGLLDIELERKGTSYTVDSLREIRARFPDVEVYFLIGADKLSELVLWREITEVVTLCRFGVFPRPGLGLDPDVALPEGADIVRAGYARQIEISSSEIRHRVAEGLSIRYLVPAGVEMMIAESHLYGS